MPVSVCVCLVVDVCVSVHAWIHRWMCVEKRVHVRSSVREIERERERGLTFPIFWREWLSASSSCAAFDELNRWNESQAWLQQPLAKLHQMPFKQKDYFELKRSSLRPVGVSEADPDRTVSHIRAPEELENAFLQNPDFVSIRFSFLFRWRLQIGRKRT